MSLITGSIKSILSINLKQRHDGYTDQVSRIFVAKVFMVASLIVGVDWFHDTIYCVIPKDSHIDVDFVHQACWIRGFYVYPEMENYMKQSAYYGIPLYSEIDGIHKKGKSLCRTNQKLYRKDNSCKAMVKHFFAQYQWMPFYIASLAILFYLPYMLFRMVNTDMISLRKLLKYPQVETKDVVQNYFNHAINSKMKMRIRVLANILVKLTYVGVNLASFNILNIILNDQYHNYGVNWSKWLRQNSSMIMDFNMREIPTPGNKMLPTFGFCDIHELAMDSKTATDNKMKVLCEISSNVLHQYVLVVLWFVLVFAIIIALVGVFINISSHIINIVCMARRDKTSKLIYRFLTFRECEYLEFIRKNDLVLYGSVVRELRTRMSTDLNDILHPQSNRKSSIDKHNLTTEEEGLVLVIGDKAHTIKQNDDNKNSLSRIMKRLHSCETTA